jgi:surfeit locus 1 family protein
LPTERRSPRERGLVSGRAARRRLNPAEAIAQQDKGEEQDRKPDPYRQRAHHPAVLGLAVAAFAHHEKACHRQGADDADEREPDHVVHVSALSRPETGLLPSGCLIVGRPGWRGLVVLLAAVLAVLATARLGFWQLDRASRSSRCTSAWKEIACCRRSRRPTWRANDLSPTNSTTAARGFGAAGSGAHGLSRQPADERRARPIRGHPAAARRQRRRDPGAARLGQRNFLDRAALPALTSPAGIVEVTGLIAPPPSRLYEFASQASGPIRQNIDVDGFAQERGLPLLPLSVLQADSAATVGDGLSDTGPSPPSMCRSTTVMRSSGSRSAP